MKKTTFSFLCLAWAATAWGQIGKYEKVNPDFTETIELFDDHRFEYSYKTAWGASKTQGKWETGSDGSLQLTSAIRYADYAVEERYAPEHAGVVQVVVGGESKGKAPKKVQKVQLIATDTVYCPMDNELIFAEMEYRQKLEGRGTPQQMDSLRRTEVRRYYSIACTQPLKAVEVLTPGYTLRVPVQNPQANHFIITTRWSDDGLYAYFDREAFLLEKKQLKQLSNQAYWKPAKK